MSPIPKVKKKLTNINILQKLIINPLFSRNVDGLQKKYIEMQFVYMKNNLTAFLCGLYFPT